MGLLCVASELKQASVTMPYAEFASLLERVSKVERSMEVCAKKPPVNVIVNSAEYLLDCLPTGRPELVAKFSVTNLSDDWQIMPLLSADLVVLAVEPVEAKLLTKDGYVCVLLAPGKSTPLHIRAQQDVSDDSSRVRTLVEFEAIPASRSVLTVQHPYESNSVLVNGSMLSSYHGAAIGLPASGGSVSVQRYEAEAMEPTQWRGSMASLVRSSVGRLLVESRIQLSATDNGRTTSNLAIAANGGCAVADKCWYGEAPSY